MTDLGTMASDESSAGAINADSQILGITGSGFGGFGSRLDKVFLWSGGVMYDTATLPHTPSTWPVFIGGGINDRGQLTGGTYNPDTGESHAILLTPTFHLSAVQVSST